MISSSDQQLFTQVARGTPAGDWLRCYWQAIAISDRCKDIRADLKLDEPVTFFDNKTATVSEWGQKVATFTGKPTRVRILGEDLVLFRDGSGRLGLLDLYCAHRRASLAYGRVQVRGLACCYHGWTFDVDGRCLDMPVEPRESTYKDKIVQRAYPVREVGGLIFAYLGKGEPPVLPMLDVIARNDGVRAVENFGLWGAHWLQIVENSVDPSHTGTLHGTGTQRSDLWSQIPAIDFTPDRFGIQTRQTRGNYDRTGYLRLPTTMLINHPWPGGKINHPRFTAIFRTPVDESHTLLFHVTFTPYVDGKLPELPAGVGYHLADFVQTIFQQDYEAIASQGPVYDRTLEKLATSDRGIMMLRKIIKEQIAAVQRGEDPPGVMRGQEWERILDSAEKVTDGFMQSAAVAGAAR
jgi:5,5'-dehydrodivanillate O-demethylase oxygenase subunit